MQVKGHYCRSQPSMGSAQRSMGLRFASASPTGLPPIQRTKVFSRLSVSSIRRITCRTANQDESNATLPGHLVPSPAQQNGNLPAVPASNSSTPGKVPVQFIVPEYLTHWGQVLKVVGSLDELGSWAVDKAPAMQWNEGHTWTLDVQLPVGAVNFKIVMHDQPNNYVRWEQGEDRSVLVPETTAVTGAPVGQVDVKCNFNDVHNSRVEVRPDRAYLKQQLKAVEARVMAIQEKKRKLDQRMSVLTNGLKKYDATVAMIADGVQAAVKSQNTSEIQQSIGQQRAVPATNGSGTSTGAAAQQQQQQLAASSGAVGRKGSLQVPILDPSQLPKFDAPAPQVGQVSQQQPVADAATTTTSSSSNGVEAAGQQPGSVAETTAVAANISNERAASELTADVGAIKASHVSETVLSATVDQLLAAAEDALARSSSSSSGSSSSMDSAQGLPLMTAGVDDAQLAEEYVEELLAAASALEQQSDQRATLLLEAAKQTGDRDMAADIEQLAAAELPPIPSVEELAEAAAAAAVATVHTSLDDDSSREASGSSSSIDDSTQLTSLPVQVNETNGQQQRPRAGQAFDGKQPVKQTSKHLERDGSITFTADSLKVDVDVKQLLANVLSRVGIPMSGSVTVSATFTPNAGGPPAQVGNSTDDAAQHLATPPAVGKQFGGSTQPQDEAREQQQQQQPGSTAPPSISRPPLNPVDAIAAVFSRGTSMDSEDDSSGTDSGNSNGHGYGNGSSMQASNEHGHTAASSRVSQQTPVGTTSQHSSTAAAGRSSDSCSRTAVGPAAAAAPAAAVQFSFRLDAEEMARQLEAKEAARRAAAERVAAALAQVEEMRRSFTTANILMQQQQQPHGRAASLAGSTTSSSRTAVQQPMGTTTTTTSSTTTSSSRPFSEYRVAFRAAPPSPAALSPGSSSSPTQASSETQGSPVSAPGALRGLPAIAATTVDPQPDVSKQTPRIGRGDEQQAEPGVVKEELSLLAALAAEVQKNSQQRLQ